MLSPDRVYVGTSAVGAATMTKPRTTITTAAETEAATATTVTAATTIPIILPPTKPLDSLPIVETKRKFSFPLLNTTSLLSEPNTISARRRFSNVSDVVTRKLSSTIGWKLPVVVPTQDLVTQGKCLCGQYIRNRLKRSGLFTKKLGLQRLRSIIGTPSAHIVREVFPALNYVRNLCIFAIPVCMFLMFDDSFQIGEELERMHPTLYTNVTRQITRGTSSDSKKSDTASVIVSAVARDLFRTNITWGKVKLCNVHPMIKSVVYAHFLPMALAHTLQTNFQIEPVCINGSSVLNFS